MAEMAPPTSGMTLPMAEMTSPTAETTLPLAETTPPTAETTLTSAGHYDLSRARVHSNLPRRQK